MLENYNIRTDLALETRERFVSDHVEIPGVSVVLRCGKNIMKKRKSEQRL